MRWCDWSDYNFRSISDRGVEREWWPQNDYNVQVDRPTLAPEDAAGPGLFDDFEAAEAAM